MIELLGLAGGAIARLTPVVMDYFKQGRDLKYEILRMDKELALEEVRAANKDREIASTSEANVDAQWAAGVVEALRTEGAPKPTSGYPLLDWLNSSVRPILTYWWCIVLYTANKAMISTLAIEANMKLSELAPIIYTDFDQTVVASIIGFWFVDRSLRAKGRGTR